MMKAKVRKNFNGYGYMVRGLSKRWKILFSCLAFLLLLYFSNAIWLPFIGSLLVVTDNLEKSDILIVLGTHREGARVDWAVKLYKRGLAKKILMCGYPVGWKTSSAEIMKKQALYLGIPQDAIILDYGWNTNGTWNNALNSLEIIQDNGFKSAIIVSSNYHSRRARLAFKKIFQDEPVKLSISACPDPSFNPLEWWKSLKSSKILLIEYIKLLYYYIIPPRYALKIQF